MKISASVKFLTFLLMMTDTCVATERKSKDSSTKRNQLKKKENDHEESHNKSTKEENVQYGTYPTETNDSLLLTDEKNTETVGHTTAHGQTSTYTEEIKKTTLISTEAVPTASKIETVPKSAVSGTKKPTEKETQGTLGFNAEILSAPNEFESLGKHKKIITQLHHLISKSSMNNMYKCEINHHSIIHRFNPFVESLHKLFLEESATVKKLIEKVLPNVPDGAKAHLTLQFKKFSTLNWSYSNLNIVKEADDAFQKMSWPGPRPLQGETEVYLYHELYESVRKLRDSVFTMEKNVKMAVILQPVMTMWQNYILRIPLGTDDLTAYEKLSKLKENVYVFMHDIQVSSLLKKPLIEKNTFLDMLQTLNHLLHHTDMQLKKSVLALKTYIDKMPLQESTKTLEFFVNSYLMWCSNSLQNLKNLLTQEKDTTFQDYLYTLQCEYENRFSIYSESNKQVFNTLDKILKQENPQNEPPTVAQLINIARIEENQIKNIILTFLQVHALFHCKQNLLYFKSAINYHVQRIPKENIEVLKKQKEKKIEEKKKEGKECEKKKQQKTEGTHVSKSISSFAGTEGEDFLIPEEQKKFVTTAAQNFYKYITTVTDAMYQNNTLSKLMQASKILRAAVRQLQFSCGTACLYCRMVKEEPAYKKGTAKHDIALNKIALSFYNALSTIDEALNSLQNVESSKFLK